MSLPVLEKIFGRSEAHPDQELARRLEKLLRSIEKPRIAHPSNFWIGREVQKTTAPILLTIPFEEKGEFAVVWAQNRAPYGLMLFAKSQWPVVDYDLWAYTRSKYRGHNISKLTLAEGIRQLAIEGRDRVLTAEILIENERTRQGAVRWLKVLGFIASQDKAEESYKRIFMAAYTKEVLKTALATLPEPYQRPEKKMSPLPPDLLTAFVGPLTESFNQGGKALLDRRRSAPA
ncbi:MAG: hypothetical protein A2900_00395 [Candidatus Chisholmbacteria bacterium RIFCSPLOWO2_01_FULL_50_28]|uniref:N-acetyltransferase domain-containing protein n=1 Tax=Candidatus Chisholmbacteria bacterium RIFCSPHIGHO2_01_FULL_52_32 TaxID=1797591 RepID=A0A1G1VR10_9BACT|nr:MAG: hypothetical protein A2786_00740 [Candidatus Chisholmbacteria bacterium RIFCSPHIGHO2_01_FULL_52_32]OGY19564.1 MAG: hypothetical protein A2900_00395 [Candidatus Chisholmbacteria bacterium RIFCSPLOWO2_01_FULL_50_28]